MKKASRVSAALVSAATATATVLTVGVDVPPDPAKRSASDDIDLAAAIQLLPDTGQYPNAKAYPDLTGGLGTVAYDASQQLADQLARAVVNGFSLTALAQAAGIDPESLLNAAVGGIPPNLIAQIVTAIGQSMPSLDILGALLGPLNSSQASLLTGALNVLGLNPNSAGTITGLLALLGLDLSDPGNLSNLFYEDLLGINVVTAGPTFSVLKMIGLDIGWVPGTPNSVADEINNSPYLELGINGILNSMIDELQAAINTGALGSLNLGVLGDILGWLGLSPSAAAQRLVNSLRDVAGELTADIPDIIHTRLTPAIGIGLGAFAIAMAYEKVVADLPNQPGGSNYEDLDPDNVNPLLGSLTILPMILINNPARPDGGMFARFAPFAALMGIDTVNPRTQFEVDGDNVITGAKLLPILVDVGYEYQPMGDFAAWPNPVTLANNLAAALMPTYMLRGLQLDGLAEQLGPQLAQVGADVAAGKPLALNLYLTIDSATLPLLEPMYLTADVLDLIGLDPLAQIPMRLANALSPALTIMTDLGYANVKRNPDGTYTRDFSTAGEEVPFMSFPDVDPFLAVSDILKALVAGFVKELGPNPTQGTPNPLSTLFGGTGGGLGDLLNINSVVAEQAINSVPDIGGQIMSFAGEQGGDENDGVESRIAATASGLDAQQPEGELDPNEQQGEQQQDQQQQDQQPPAAPEPGQQQPAAPEQQQAELPQLPKLKLGPRHAKVEKDGDAPVLSLGNAPKHARNIIRESLNFAPNAETKKENTEGGNEETSQVVAPPVTATPNEQGTQENPGAEQGSEEKDKGSEAA